MHSMSLPSGGTAHFNGDFSGEVVFEDCSSMEESEIPGLVRIPFEDIEKLVLEKYRRETISKLEQMDTAELVNLFGRAW